MSRNKKEVDRIKALVDEAIDRLFDGLTDDDTLLGVGTKMVESTLDDQRKLLFEVTVENAQRVGSSAAGTKKVKGSGKLRGRNDPVTGEESRWMIQLRKEGCSYQEIGDIVGRHFTTVGRYLRDAGLGGFRSSPRFQEAEVTS